MTHRSLLRHSGLFAFGLTVSLFGLTFFWSPKTSAAPPPLLTLKPDPGGDILSRERDQMRVCNQQPNSPAYFYYLTEIGGSNVEVNNYRVTPSSGSIKIRFNWAAVVCHPNNDVDVTSLSFSSRAPGITGLQAGLGVDYRAAPGGVKVPGTYRATWAEFEYSPPGGFTASGKYTIQVGVKRINHFVGPNNYLCVNSGARLPKNIIDFDACSELILRRDVWVTVDNKPAPTVAVRDIDCDRISVSTNGKRVDVYGPSGMLGSTGDGNRSGEITLEGVVPVGTKLSIFGIEDGVNTFGNTLLEHVWNPASTCRRDFTTIPSASVTVNDSENPTLANFRVAAKLDTGGPPTVNGVNATYRFYIKRSAAHNFDSQSLPVALTTSDLERTLSNVDLTPFGLKAGDEICSRIEISPKQGVADIGGTIITVNDPGPAVGEECKPVANKPYVIFNGSDVKAGGSVAAVGANCDASAGIKTFRNASNQGSSTQLAAFALGAINGITSATNASTGVGSNPVRDGLTVPDFGTYGGQCVHDFYADRAGSAWSGFAGSEGKFTATGPLPIPGGSVAENQHIFLYVEGDVNITNNITLAPSWTGDRSRIPVFYLVATGNINIAPTVTQLDGVYIAQNLTAGKGEIRTCAVGGTAVAVTDMYNVCGEQLVVNGAFIAKKVNLGRAYGSLRNAAAPTDAVYAAGGPAKSCTTSVAPHATTPNCAAEVFRYTPSMYLGLAPEEIGAETSGVTPFMFVTSLPPVL